CFVVVSEKVRISSSLLRSVDEYLSSGVARAKGFRSRRDVVEEAIRVFLEREGFWARQRFEHVNADGDHVIILDRLVRRVATVYFRYPDRIFCDLCCLEDCEHVVFALTIDKVSRTLERLGFRVDRRVMERLHALEDMLSSWSHNQPQHS
ncbi:MAG: hypothetical protein QXD32_02310, partial [Nitrososphaerota archaeon]